MKRIGLIAILTILLSSVGLLGFGIYQSINSRPEFYTGGYALTGDTGSVKQLSFTAETSYVSGGEGYVQFKDVNGDKVEVMEQSFFYLDDGSIMALAGGVLFDFNDLSSNFINNYYITATLPITANNGTYTAETTSGTMEFGENLWKLSDGRYLIQSPTLSVFFAEGDIREVADFIQVTISDDGIVQLLSAENRWVTISEACYIETEGGVQIYPVTQLVDNGTYKMSMAKLSVSPDDSIVLTEDETRRQIVPEILIETIDGEDGESGEDGTSGSNGQDGQIGEDGEDGIDGIDGIAGQTGVTGTSGATGEAGAAGSDGSSGSKGSSGSDGTDGLAGGSGLDGSSAGDSSINSALPTVSVTEWNVSATALSGALLVSDLSETLVLNEPNYPFLVTIYDATTGETITCYQKSSSDDLNWDTDSALFEFDSESLDGVTLYFSTEDTALEPDHQYILSVTAYYTYGDEVVTEYNTIFSRELLNRTFYTDSTGVILTLNDQTTETITINVLLASGYEDSVQKATVLLLTEAQNEAFNSTTFNDSDVTQYYEIDYNNEEYSYYYTYGDTTVTDPNNALNLTSLTSIPITFGLTPDGATISGELPSDTQYVARVIVSASTDAGSITKLTSQELDVTTLKVSPEWDTDTYPSASYNRSNGAFEVTVPPITDLDSGIAEYTVTVYNSAGEVVATKTVLPERLSSASFYLASETDYYFGVTFTFYDNEKTITYDMGISEAIQSTGDSMPTLSLSEISSDNNEWEGLLYVNLAGSSSALLDGNNPWTLTLYADQVWEETITINTLGTVFTDNPDTGRYTISASISESGNTVTFNLNFDNLLNNVSYTLAVNGCVNLNDGSVSNDATEYPSRSLGSVTFRTTTNRIISTGDWGGGSSEDFLTYLTLSLADPADGETALTDAEQTDVATDLSNGIMTVSLYSGSGNDAVFMESKTYSGDAMSTAFTTGVTIQESDFSTMSQVTGSSDDLLYTLEITSLTDYTYDMEDDLGYANEYSVDESTHYITVLPSPPDLTTTPNEAISAEPVYNYESNTYGKTVDGTLPDDAIVGYKLTAGYNNGEQVAQSITYYAFEAEAAATDVLGNDDPINNKSAIFSTEHTFDGNSATPIVVFFGDNPANADGVDNDPDANNIVGGAYVHYAGDVVMSDNPAITEIASGMGRGFRYLFAYTVSYSVGDVKGYTYPYDMSDYDAYKTNYGLGELYSGSDPVGQGVVYMLNSGVVEAPRATPTIASFVESSDASIIADGTTYGSMVINYKFDDPDDTINNTTTMSYTGGDATGANELSVKGTLDPDGWYYQTFDYTVDDNLAPVDKSSSNPSIDPLINADWYAIEYDRLQYWGWDGENSETLYLTHTPVEWAWGADLTTQRTATYTSSTDSDDTITYTATDSLVNLTADLVETSNKYTFTIKTTSNAASATYFTNLMSRAYGLKVTFTPHSYSNTASLPAEFEVFLPLTQDSTTQYSAELPLNQITDVANYVGVSMWMEASICYDDGTQGWDNLIMSTEDISETIAANKSTNVSGSYVDVNELSSGYFALQQLSYYNSSSGTYYNTYHNLAVTGEWSDTPASTMMKQLDGSEITLSAFRNAVNFSTDSGVLLSGLNLFNEQEPTYYLYPNNIGMGYRSNASTTSNANYYLSAKGTAYHTFTNNYIESIESLMPSVSAMTDPSTTTSITISSITLDNLNAVNSDSVILALYSTLDAANAMGTDTATCLGFTTIDLTDGTTSQTYTDILTVDNLDKGTTYYLAAYYTDDDTVENILLLKGITSSGAIYECETLGDLEFTSAYGLRYTNNSYFQKTLSLTYSLDRATGITVEYDMFASDDEPTYGASDVTAEQMVLSQTALYAMMKKTVYDENYQLAITSASNISFSMDLSPTSGQSAFKPGETYWVRVRVYEDGVLLGYKYYGTEVFSAEKATSFVSMSNVTASSMTFTVTVSEAYDSATENTSYSYMGLRKLSDSGYGLYTVRFFQQPEGSTDTDITTWDEVLPIVNDSIYDRTKTYSMNSVQQAFVLTELDTSTNYAIKLYAVWDEYHTNESPLMYTGTEDVDGNPSMRSYGYEELFGDDSGTTAITASYPFTTYVGTYLVKDAAAATAAQTAIDAETEADEKANLEAAEELRITEEEARIAEEDAKFCLASRSEETTSASGIKIKDSVSMTRYDNTTIRLSMTECYGLIQNNAQMITKINLSVTATSGVGSSTTSYTYTTGDDIDFVYVSAADSSSGVEYYYYDLPPLLYNTAIYQISVELYSDAEDGGYNLELDRTFYITST